MQAAARRSWVGFQPGDMRCGLCMFSLCLVLSRGKRGKRGEHTESLKMHALSTQPRRASQRGRSCRHECTLPCSTFQQKYVPAHTHVPKFVFRNGNVGLLHRSRGLIYSFIFQKKPRNLLSAASLRTHEGRWSAVYMNKENIGLKDRFSMMEGGQANQ